MIIINFDKNGTKTRAELPSKWEEMTVKQYLQIETTKNGFELLALLSGVPLDDILNTKTDLSAIVQKMTELLSETPPNFREVPRRLIEIEGKTVKIPSNFQNVTFGQSALIESYLQESKDDERAAVAQCMGVILQPLLDGGRFNLDRAAEITRKVEEMPIIDVFPNVFFFWTKLQNYLIIGRTNYALLNPPTPNN